MKLTLVRFTLIVLSIILLIFGCLYFVFNCGMWSIVAAGICACIIVGIKTGSSIEKIECTVAFSNALTEIFTELEIDEKRAADIMIKCMNRMEGDK